MYTYIHNYINQVEVDEMGINCRTNGEKNAYKILVGKPEGKRQLGRSSRTWEDTIQMDVREIGWSGMDWVDLAQDMDQWSAVVNLVMNLSGSLEC
jgi:hypothetical protein